MRLRNDPEIRTIIEEEWVKMFEEQRDKIRKKKSRKFEKIICEYIIRRQKKLLIKKMMI